MKNKKLLVYFNNLPSPYVVNRLNNLNQNNDFNVEGWFLNRKDSNQGFEIPNNRKFNFKYQFINKKFLVRSTTKYKPDILITLYSNFTFIINILFYRLIGTKILLHAVKTFDTWNKRSFFKEITKFFIFNIVNGFHVPGLDAKKQIKKYLLFKKFFFITPWNQSLNNKKVKIKLKKKRRLLYVGRVNYEKGILILIKAIKSLNHYNNFILNIVGPIDKNFNIRQIIIKEKLNKKIHLVKKQKKEQLLSFYKNSDIFIFPSLGEPYGLVIDEALSYGLPIISSNNVGELSDRVKNNFNGFIYNYKSHQQLSKKIKYLINNKNLIKKFSKNSYLLSKSFNHKNYRKNLLKFIND